MIGITGIRFQQDGKMIYYSASGLEPRTGDYVIVQTEQGMELGEVLLGVHEVPEERFQSPLPSLIRIATEQDIRQATENRQREKEAYGVCQQKIAEHGLEMKLVSVECVFDRSKMLFYFTANGRVDFRALVKDLASTFKTRIELRQIGVRDEARMLGGLGACGRPICCGAFLKDFEPVSIKMAKEQNLSLNPTKISGVCGRLMCCLKYEQDQYECTRKKMPRIGRSVMTPNGQGTVTDLNMIKETVSVRLENGDNSEIKVFTLEEIIAAAEKASSEKANRNEGLAGSDHKLSSVSETETEPETEGDETESEAKLLSKDPSASDGGEFINNTQSERNDNSLGRHSGKNTARNRKTERNEKKRGSERCSENPQKVSGSGDRTGKKAKSIPSKSNRGNKRSADLANEKTEDKSASSHVYGKPVRRENRERNRSDVDSGKGQSDAAEPKEKGEVVQTAHEERSSAPQAENRQNPKSSGWADALEKALQAVDQ